MIIAFNLLKFYLSAHAGVEQTKRVVMSIEDLICAEWQSGCGKQALLLQGWGIEKMVRGLPSLPSCRESPYSEAF